MEIRFETRRLYVAPKRSVLFFAKVEDRRVRCYVPQDLLIGAVRALRDDADVYQRSLVAYDEHRELVHYAARVLIERLDDLRDAVVVSNFELPAGPGHYVLTRLAAAA